MSNLVFDTPILYSVSSTGKLQQWKVTIHSNDDGTATIVREHGYVDKKIQRIEKNVYVGKAIGRADETSPYEQAIREGLSLRTKRMDTGWTDHKPNMESYEPPKLPMLALPFTKRKHNITYPAYVQPKLNGVRCLAEKVSEHEIVFTSRKGKHYDTIDHLTPNLLKCMKVGEIFDGEIYIPGKTFQHIVRLVKKLRTLPVSRALYDPRGPIIHTKKMLENLSSCLQYHVYDIVDVESDFESRNSRLEERIFARFDDVVYVATIPVHTEADVYSYHDNFVEEGYEGIIIRNREGNYKLKSRSKNLQKYKHFFDEEFEIVGGKSGTGLHEGCVVFEVKTNDGHVFNSYPKGTLEERREMFNNLDSYIGKMLTVRYQELSEDGVPIFPVGIVVRDYE